MHTVVVSYVWLIPAFLSQDIPMVGSLEARLPPVSQLNHEPQRKKKLESGFGQSRNVVVYTPSFTPFHVSEYHLQAVNPTFPFGN